MIRYVDEKTAVRKAIWGETLGTPFAGEPFIVWWLCKLPENYHAFVDNPHNNFDLMALGSRIVWVSRDILPETQADIDRALEKVLPDKDSSFSSASPVVEAAGGVSVQYTPGLNHVCNI
jgi:hypothetical protein